MAKDEDTIKEAQEALRARFWRKVDKRGNDECWEWNAYRDKCGYGAISGGRRGLMLLAHRASWELHHGAVSDGLHVLHRCDNPACVNPAHLFLGTHQDNMTDMALKGRRRGRGPRGAQHHKAKLAETQVDEIRKARGVLREIAGRFGVSISTVHGIRRGLTWCNHG